MKLKVLKCPDCGGELEIVKGREVFFCQYCGCKIIMDELSDTELNAHINIRSMEHRERMKDKEYEQARYKNDKKIEQERYKVETKRKNDRRDWLIIFGIFGSIFVICFFMMFNGDRGKEKQELELQSIVDEIMVDIEKENFRSAYVKANSLYWEDSWTSEGEEKWDATREAILKQIEEAEIKKTGQSTMPKQDENDKDSSIFDIFK